MFPTSGSIYVPPSLSTVLGSWCALLNVAEKLQGIWPNPKKLHTSVAKFGVGHCNIFLHLDNCGSMPCADMWWLRKSNSVKKNQHFFGFMYKCARYRACKAKSMCFSCSSKLSDHITRSSMYTWQMSPISSHNAAVMRRWCIGGAFFRPISIATHSCNPKGVVTAIRCTLSGWTRV